VGSDSSSPSFFSESPGVLALREIPAPDMPAIPPDEGDAEEEEEEEMDPETKRRMELRERMAKMSGGIVGSVSGLRLELSKLFL
jgi:hypothetical protein